jgi:chromosome segregation ATPase
MDKNYISALEDTSDSISKKITLIKKYFKEITPSNNSSKQKILPKIKLEFDGIKTDLRLMKTDLMNLQQSENQTIWKEKYSNFKSQKEKLEIEINKLKSEGKNEINDEEDYMDINKKVDLAKLSSEKVMKRGDKILEEDEKSLQNMIKTLSKGRSMMQDTNKELYRQMDAMDRIDGELNEMDGSLNRAKKTINYMNKIA